MASPSKHRRLWQWFRINMCLHPHIHPVFRWVDFSNTISQAFPPLHSLGANPSSGPWTLALNHWHLCYEQKSTLTCFFPKASLSHSYCVLLSLSAVPALRFNIPQSGVNTPWAVLTLMAHPPKFIKDKLPFKHIAPTWGSFPDLQGCAVSGAGRASGD